jgi:hypothetical protein
VLPNNTRGEDYFFMAKSSNTINLIYPYFNNPQMLSVQVDNWNSYAEALLPSVHIIVVDDHSDIPPDLILQRCRVRKSLLRFKEPGLWTMHEARNLGALFSIETRPDAWLFLSDIDLVATNEIVEALIDMNLDPTFHYTFARILAPKMTAYRFHRNSYLLTPKCFTELNGYDIDFCGLYGGGYGGDEIFAQQLKWQSRHCHLKNLALILFKPDTVADARTDRWDREEWHAKYLMALQKKRHSKSLRSVDPIRRAWEQRI